MAREKRCGQIGAVRTKRSLQTSFRLPAEAGLILPQLLTEPERRLCGLLVNAAQHGQHAVPQAVSRVIIAEVGAVRDVILPVFAQERLNLAPLCEQERPDDRAAHRRNAGNTLRAAAAHQMEQHGLQIVVRIVRHRDFGSVRCERAAMSQRPTFSGTPRSAHSARQNASSLSDSAPRRQ